MATDLQGLAQILEASLDPAQNKQGQSVGHDPSCVRHLIVHTAEAAIGEAEKKPGFSVSLLQIVANEGYGATARLASALYFKNYIKRNWTVGLHPLSFGFDC